MSTSLAISSGDLWVSSMNGSPVSQKPEPAASQGFALSPQQERLWLLQQADADASPVYTARCAILLEGSLNLRALKAAWRHVAQQHEILRTTFVCPSGKSMAVQRVNGAEMVPELEFNSGCLEARSEEANIEALWREQMELGFDLRNGPPLRAALCNLAPLRNVMLISLHSLCADAATLKNLVPQVSRAYGAALGNDRALSELLQYADYAGWQVDWLSSEEAEAGRRYWHDQASSPTLVPKLPFRTQSEAGSSFRPGLQSIHLSSDLLGRLETLSRKLDSPLAEILFACWSVLLGRLTDQSEVTIGRVSEARSYPEWKEALGLYTKHLPFRCSFQGELSFVQVLRQLKPHIQEIEQFQAAFCADEANTAHSTATTSFYFEFNDISDKWLAGGLTFSLVKQYFCAERFEIKLAVLRRADALRLEFHFDPACFRTEDIERVSQQFSALVDSVLTQPERPVGQLNLLSDAERHQLLVDFNRTQAAFPKSRCAHTLIEEQAKRTPESTALVWKDQRLTYRALNARANRLAHHLLKLGVGPETLVALCVERSPEMIVGILGILKAGGAYVPLDPSYPKERLSFILEDTHSPILLTQAQVQTKLPPHHATTVLLDEKPEWAESENTDDPEIAVQPAHLAYVIYTSGSTGKPKGVLVTHRNLVHSTSARISCYREPLASYLLVSSFAFDSSVAGIFWTLWQGGALVLPEEEGRQDPRQLSQLIRQYQISHCLCLPSWYALLLDEPSQLASLRTVIVAGESCPRELVDRHRKQLPQAGLYNEYGPTEATVWSSVFDCQSPRPCGPIPIGRPIPNAQIYILDSSLQPAPTWAAGELYIGGEGVVRGYLNRPELTAEKFIPNPFSSEPGARLYRTGDLGRYWPDGTIEFLGRLDHQVKMRGYRIELEEIEFVLKQHPAVREAVVVTREAEAFLPRQENGSPAATEDVAERLAQLGPERVEQLLAEVESLAEEGAGVSSSHPPSETAADRQRRFLRRAEFEVSLEITDDQFIHPPREAQRNWLLNRALNEFGDDLAHLDKVAKRFVPGSEVAVESLVADRSQAVLAEEEILEDWHQPLMKAMAKAVTESHGDILEVGFGRGLSAGMIQESGVRSHTIIECNDHILDTHYQPWRSRFANRDIRLLHGKWQEVTDQMGLYDGIFFQTYPLDEREFVEYLAKSATFAEHFFPTAAAHLRTGGVFTYLTHEIDSLSRRHQRLIFQYFSSMTLSIEPLRLPENGKDLWWADSMVVVKALK